MGKTFLGPESYFVQFRISRVTSTKDIREIMRERVNRRSRRRIDAIQAASALGASRKISAKVASRSEDTENEKETERDERQEDRRGKARHNESRLRRQAERGRSGPVHIAFASAISPRSSLVPRACAIVCGRRTYVQVAHREGNAVATRRTSRNPRAGDVGHVIPTGIIAFSGWTIRGGRRRRRRRRLTSIPVWPRLFIARYCDV